MEEHLESGDAANPYAAPHTSPDELPTNADIDIDVGELRPFKTIWMRPRATIRAIVATDPKLHVVPLVCLSGIAESLDRASLRSLGDQMPVVAIICIACVLGPLGGLVSLWIGSHLIRFTGTWIGGGAVREHIRTAIAWSSVPAVFALPLWIPELLLFGADMFTTETPRLEAQPILFIPFLAIGLIEIVLAVWGFVILCKTVAEVQGFRSAWSGFGNLILAGAVLLVPILVLVMVFVLAPALLG